MAESRENHIFNTVEEAESFVKVFAAANYISFVITRATKGFGTCEVGDCGVRKIYWKDDIPTFRVGIKVRQCNYKFQHHRRMRKKTSTEHACKARTLEDLQEYKDLLIEDSDSADCCPAKAIIKEVIEFPDYKIPKITKKEKDKSSNKLRMDLTANFRITNPRKIFYCEVPRKEDHEGHNLGDVSCKYQKMENYLAEEIKKLQDEGITDTAVVKHHLMESVAAITVLPVDAVSGEFVSPYKEVYKQIHSAKRVTVADSESDTLDEVIVMIVFLLSMVSGWIWIQVNEMGKKETSE